MIRHPAFSTDPWSLRCHGLDLSVLAQLESVFALSNGHIGWRGNLDEGEPHGMPGAYLSGFFELRPLPYAEPGYGYPESGQTVLNITNGKLIRLLVDDEPLDVRDGQLRRHDHELDFRDGLLRRTVEWTSPAGKSVRVRSTRLVSLSQRAIAAVCYEVEALTEPIRIVVQSELVTNEELPESHNDPRVAATLKRPLVPLAGEAAGERINLAHRTAGSKLSLAVAMQHVVTASAPVQIDSESEADRGRATFALELGPDTRFRLIKFVSHGWSGTRSLPALQAQVDAALAGAVSTGWEGLLTEQRHYLDEFWAGADVRVDGDPELQQAVRFALFHVLQAGARTEGQPIPAKGLTGAGYDGHAFWDSESFVLPLLTYTVPSAAAHALRWRHKTLPAARHRAHQLRLQGAAFPWRTIDGRECSGYWPAGTAAFHVNADIADAVVRYVRATGDQRFEAEVGVDLLVQTARLWISLGHADRQGHFHIDGVTGPDEYSAIADDNIYTNLMAQQNLRAAAAAARRHPGAARSLRVSDQEMSRWDRAAAAVAVPFDPHLQVHAQSEGFTRQQRWDFNATAAGDYPLMLHFPYYELYRKQVVKQADLVLAMHLRHDAFTAAEKARNFAYYEAITVRDSSLSASTQAVIAAEVGQLRLAADYLAEAAFIDLGDIEHNTRDGLHLASLAGIWNVLTAGYGGMRHGPDGLRFAPRLPPDLTRLAFNLRLGGGTLRVDVCPEQISYRLEGLPVLRFRCYDEDLEIRPGHEITTPVRPGPTAGTAPQQPAHRRPHGETFRRGRTGSG